MRNLKVSLFLILLLSLSAQAQQNSRNSPTIRAASSDTLQELVNEAAHTALVKFADKKLAEAQLSITLIDLRDPQHPASASFRGNERVYPASVVKLFYLSRCTAGWRTKGSNIRTSSSAPCVT